MIVTIAIIRSLLHARDRTLVASAPMIPAPRPAKNRLVARIARDGETSVSAVLAIVRHPPFSAQRRAECAGAHIVRQIVESAAVASSRLKRNPADFSESPAWT